MPHFQCRCGYKISTTNTPSEHEYVLVGDGELDSLEGATSEISEALDALLLRSRQVIQCPGCRRVWIEESAGSGRFYPYISEERPQ